MKEFINKNVEDSETKKIETVIEITSNSVLVTQTKLNKNGINCNQWFTDKQFYKQFKII